MALMLAPRDLRLFRSKAVHGKTLIIPRHLRTSRQPVRNHFTLKKYRIDARWVDCWSAEIWRGFAKVGCLGVPNVLLQKQHRKTGTAVNRL